ncbi:MAG: SusC/RagA family TonB-linked outer membrane protein [Bacteroidales bacterium]|nr:SusC/RagA family TonB-linked outer membrane protein [Bacteroidales bacterium]MDT8373151.1 SusC/RagA family TonB-linked outer membrane protein [Bacteroidales bacterium]
MNRLKLLIALFVLTGFSALMAQTVTLKGTVTSAEDGLPIPSVTVTVKGTTVGTLTGPDGSYTLVAPTNATQLSFTFVGMKSVTEVISGRTTIDVVMETDMLGLDEVVVTALGISRDKKSLGYAVQDLSSDKIDKAKVSNIVNAFQGKLSGVQINNTDGGVASGVRILIRGVNSLSASGNTQPLFVVDGVPIVNVVSDAGAYGGMDYGNMSSDINPSDVESITVLKGASAAALYGSRAVNGVVLITTKSGKSGVPGLGVTIEQNTMWENPFRLPKFQNLYGQGGGGEFSYVDGNYGGINDGVDESWGPPLDGRLIPQFDSPYDPETDVRTPTPWVAHPDNIKDFFETGIKRTTNVSVTGSKEGASFRLSLSNQGVKGILPNTDLTKNSAQLNGEYSVTDRITVGGSANYINNSSDNIAENGYNAGNPMQSLMQWFGRQVDMDVLKEKWNETDPKTGLPFNWNHSYHNNPYWTLNKSMNSRNRDRLIGNVNFGWNFTDWLAFKAQVGTDWSIEDIKERTAKGDIGQEDPEGGYNAYSNRRSLINANARLEFVKSFGDFDFDGSVGADYNHYEYQYHRTTVPDLIVPDLYSVSNSAAAATTGLSESRYELQSVFGVANFGYKNWLFLNLTGRNDWSSTLPIDNNSYFYPSVSLAWILTDALGIESPFLSFLKLRASYAEVGGSAGAYALNGVYSAGNPYDGNPSLSYTGTIPPLGLKPQRKRSKEAGLELRFLNNRLALDAAIYRENTVNQIMNIAVSRTTGFSSQTINAGNLQNQGIELQLLASPVQTNNFSWDVTVNWSTNENKVVELYGDMKYLSLYSGSWGSYVYAIPGQEYGTLWGYAIVRENATPVYYNNDPEQGLSHYAYSGRPLVSTSGRYIRSGARTDLGNIYPDWFGGINNSFTYKDFNFSFLVDFRKGGLINSITHMFGMYTGIFEETAAINANGKNVRDPLDEGGGVLIDDAVYGKVNADGTIQFLNADGSNSSAPVTNTTYVDANRWGYDHYAKTELNTFDGSFVKLREVSAGYSFNKIDALRRIGIKNLTLSVVGRNLLLIFANIPHIDPEVANSAGNRSVGAENNAIPSTRSYGFNIRLDF